MALARADRLTFSYPGTDVAALREVSLSVEPGEVVLLIGPSGGGKSTLLRGLAGLVPHFHGGRFSGRVEVAGRDTRSTRPAELAGTVATLFQDPEEQVVFGGVLREVCFGLENLGVPAPALVPRALDALEAVGVAALADRGIAELSGGELQRVCLASAFALDPELLLLDEPTSQLDPEGAEHVLELASGRGCAVVVSEQRPSRALAVADRVVFLEGGRIVLDAPREEALDRLAAERPAWTAPVDAPEPACAGECVCRLGHVDFAYGQDRPALAGFDLSINRGEIVVLIGPNGSGKTTVAKLAAGLLAPQAGAVDVHGRARLLLQDADRYAVAERADEEVALGLGGDLGRARRALADVGLAAAADRHPRDLSTGERERLALACVLATEPDLLVLDEPTRGVDPERKAELAAHLRRDAPARATLVVTHDRSFATAVADRTVELASERSLVLG